MRLEWIDGVPDHWKVAESQFVLVHQKREVQDDDEIVTAFRDGQVTLRSKRRTDGFTMADKEIGYQHICEGDLVVHSMDGGFGAIGVSDSCGKASPVVHAYTSDSCDLRFISYQLRSAVNAGWIAALAKGIRVRSTQFDRPALAGLKIAYPSLESQQRIADYLDRETAEIDAAVANLDRYVELLEERKIQTVENAVFGDHEGEFPLVPIQLLFKKIMSGTTPKGEHYYTDAAEDMPWITTSELREVDIYETKKCITTNALKEVSSLSVYPPDTILIAMYGATIGRFGRTRVAATSNQACCALFEPVGIDPEFFYNSLFALSKRLVEKAVGGGQPNINQDTIRRFRIPVPPPEKQRKIAVEVAHMLADTNALIGESTKLRDLLLKRRSVLITDVVTGRKQV